MPESRRRFHTYRDRWIVGISTRTKLLYLGDIPGLVKHHKSQQALYSNHGFRALTCGMSVWSEIRTWLQGVKHPLARV